MWKDEILRVLEEGLKEGKLYIPVEYISREHFREMYPYPEKTDES
jgi:hypothetical protein